MKRFLFIAILILGCCSPAIMAQKFAAAYLDMQYILKNLPQYEIANEQLAMISKRWQKEIDNAQQEVQILVSNYQTEQIFLSADMKKKREDEILEKEQQVLELKRKYFAPDGELYKKRESLMAPIQDEIYNAVKELADAKGYSLILDRASDASIIFASPRIDISNEVLSKLGYSE